MKAMNTWFVMSLLAVLSLPCRADESTSRHISNLDVVILDLGGATVYGGAPTVWISTSGHSYSSIIAKAEQGTYETRYRFDVTMTQMTQIKARIAILLKERHHKFRIPGPGEAMAGIFLFGDGNKKLCFEKPAEEPWKAFDELQNYLLQLHQQAVKRGRKFYRQKAKNPPIWDPSGFPSWEQRMDMRPSTIR